MPRVDRGCPGCGDTITFYLQGKRKDVERKADWIMGQGRLCDKCTAQVRQKENEKAARTNAEAGLPELSGSIAQIPWAETIRARVFELLTPYERVFFSQPDEFDQACQDARNNLHMWARELLADMVTVIQKHDRQSVEKEDLLLWGRNFLTALKVQVRASWWIDNRSASLKQLVHELRDQIVTIGTEDPDLEAAVMAEATLQPSTPITKTVATVNRSNNKIYIKFIEKNETFRLTVKKQYGFVWNDEVAKWELAIGPTHGELVDRAAEVIHKLVGQGFIVCCLDDEIRERAINASFSPRYPRWIFKCVSGRWANWLCVQWFDDAGISVFQDAMKLPGAKECYRTNNVLYVRSTHWGAIADFSQIHKFRLTPGAEQALKQAEDAEKSRLKVQMLPDAPSIDIQSDDQVAPATGEIDELLRDDD